MPKRKTYSREFKIDAVKLVTDHSMTRKQVARDLDVDIGTLRNWIKQFTHDPQQACPGKGHVRDEELRPLKREVLQLRMERDILKKAIGTFSQMPR